jgi:hypothetical protein
VAPFRASSGAELTLVQWAGRMSDQWAGRRSGGE